MNLIHGRAAAANFAEAALSYLRQVAAMAPAAASVSWSRSSPTSRPLRSPKSISRRSRGARRITYPKASPANATSAIHHPGCRCPAPCGKAGLMPDADHCTAESARWCGPLAEARGVREAARGRRPTPPSVARIPVLHWGRIGEALWLDWRNVDLARAHVSFVKTKNAEAARSAPCFPGDRRAGEHRAPRRRGVQTAERTAVRTAAQDIRHQRRVAYQHGIPRRLQTRWH